MLSRPFTIVAGLSVLAAASPASPPADAVP
jgi:hypothetical protein